MALNLDDKILGERVQCFVSDSESESESENNGEFFNPNIRQKAQTKPQKPRTGWVLVKFIIMKENWISNQGYLNTKLESLIFFFLGQKEF